MDVVVLVCLLGSIRLGWSGEFGLGNLCIMYLMVPVGRLGLVSLVGLVGLALRWFH